MLWGNSSKWKMVHGENDWSVQKKIKISLGLLAPAKTKQPILTFSSSLFSNEFFQVSCSMSIHWSYTSICSVVISCGVGCLCGQFQKVVIFVKPMSQCGFNVPMCQSSYHHIVNIHIKDDSSRGGDGPTRTNVCGQMYTFVKVHF